MKVASVPRRHVYTRHIGWPGDGVERIATPDQTYRASDLLDPGWVRGHADDFACFHTHFGFGDVDLPTLRAWRDALREVDRPHVHTVHDLENPHHPDQTHHRSQLDLLVGEADAVVTLTGRAADRIEARWGRRPIVLPHPHVVELERVGLERPVREPLVIGIHLKDLRAALHGPELCEEVADAIAGDDRFALRIDAYPAACEREPETAARLGSLAERPRVELALHPYGTDDEFEDYVRSIDVALLPYRWGTHSGWAEACLDVGTQVLAPETTCIPDQHERIQALDLEAPDLARRLREVLDRCWAQRDDGPLTREERTRQRQDIARAHAELYAEVVG
jgi:beta-1,4-mannosyltransferase